MQSFSNTTQRPTTLHPVTIPHPPKPLPAFRFGHAAGEEYRYSTLKWPDAQKGILFPIPQRIMRIEQPLGGSSVIGTRINTHHASFVPSLLSAPSKLLRAADRYAYTGCGSTAYSVGTVYGGKGHLYTPGVCPGLLATPCIASLATPRRLAGDHLAPHWRSPYVSLAITLCPTGDHLMPHRRSPCR